MTITGNEASMIVPDDIETNTQAKTSEGLSFLMSLAQAQWNAIIPKSAVRVEEHDGSSIKYLHPTKGWRYVAKKRLRVFA